MSQRTEQIASVIHTAVQRVITRGLNDPRVRGLVSVTKVEVAPDLHDARVFVSVLPAEHAELTIQAEISKEVAARRLPRLSFRLDESLKKQAMIESEIREHRPGADQGDEL